MVRQERAVVHADSKGTPANTVFLRRQGAFGIAGWFATQPYGQRIKPHSGLAKGREKTRSDLRPDAVHEQNQAELFDEIERLMVDVLREMAGENRGDEHAGRAQLDASDTDAPCAHAHDSDQGENRDGVVRGIGTLHNENPAHKSLWSLPHTVGPAERTSAPTPSWYFWKFSANSPASLRAAAS
jgi:hypothetical protein